MLLSDHVAAHFLDYGEPAILADFVAGGGEQKHVIAAHRTLHETVWSMHHLVESREGPLWHQQPFQPSPVSWPHWHTCARRR